MVFKLLVSLIAAFICLPAQAQSTVVRGNDLPALHLDSAASTCDHLLSAGYLYQTDGRWKESYDTLRMFMEQCPFYVGGQYNGGVKSWQGFSYIGGAVSQWAGGGVGRWPDYLNWLKKVLYLNADTMWYCSDVEQMLTAEQQDENAKMSILRYIISSGKCASFPDNFQSTFSIDSSWRFKFWLDSVKLVYATNMPGPEPIDWPDSVRDAFTKDTMEHPMDTTIPSLQQEGLQVLLGRQYQAVSSGTPISGASHLKAYLVSNPISSEIAISFDFGREALVTIELRDVLGRAVPLERAKYQIVEPGTHQAYIPAANLPSGTYYLRLSTDTGETKTLKIVKE